MSVAIQEVKRERSLYSALELKTLEPLKIALKKLEGDVSSRDIRYGIYRKIENRLVWFGNDLSKNFEEFFQRAHADEKAEGKIELSYGLRRCFDIKYRRMPTGHYLIEFECSVGESDKFGIKNRLAQGVYELMIKYSQSSQEGRF